MLPPALSEVKARLSQKAYGDCSASEKRLLHELEALEDDPIIRQRLVTSPDFATRIVAGPVNVCSCCGRPL